MKVPHITLGQLVEGLTDDNQLEQALSSPSEHLHDIVKGVELVLPPANPTRLRRFSSFPGSSWYFVREAAQRLRRFWQGQNGLPITPLGNDEDGELSGMAITPLACGELVACCAKPPYVCRPPPPSSPHAFSGIPLWP